MRLHLAQGREYAPGRDRAVVGRLLLGVGRVIALNDVDQVGNRVLLPLLPPFPLDDRAFLTRRVLLPLRLPLLLGQRRLGRGQRVQIPVLRPHGPAARHDGWKLDQLPLVRLGFLRLRIDQFSRQVLHGPSRHDDDDGASRLQTLPWATGIPLISGVQ